MASTSDPRPVARRKRARRCTLSAAEKAEAQRRNIAVAAATANRDAARRDRNNKAVAALSEGTYREIAEIVGFVDVRHLKTLAKSAGYKSAPGTKPGLTVATRKKLERVTIRLDHAEQALEDATTERGLAWGLLFEEEKVSQRALAELVDVKPGTVQVVATSYKRGHYQQQVAA